MLVEAASYLERIDDLRGQVAELIGKMPAEALNWRPVDDGQDDHATNSLAVLVAHLAGGEQFWIHEVIGGYPTRRQREQEFLTAVEEAAPLLAVLEANRVKTHQVLAGLTEAEIAGSRQAQGWLVPVRWAILHVIDHTALHLGHMQLTCQLWQGGLAHNAPRWFQRLKNNG